MKMKIRQSKWMLPNLMLVGICCLFLLSGCSLWHNLFGLKDEPTPAEIMSEGMEDFNVGDFEKSIETFQKIKDRYPYSTFAITAELKMADAYYEKGQYVEARDEYAEFEKMHPRNKNVPYVVYQQGMCYFSESAAIDRGQANTYKAREEFERLIKRFRKSNYTEHARRKVRECYIKLAEHELYVGDFYFKKGTYQPAMDRYLYLIAHYPDVGQYYQALESIRKCKERIKELDGVQETSWLNGFLYDN
ncbi:MAG: outer membrane protein assembly factor BamD [Deltaproteobacteria bacterium]|nr:outer membrane protein assembly factor BamD [Deltaproteobacteria bacterium]